MALIDRRKVSVLGRLRFCLLRLSIDAAEYVKYLHISDGILKILLPPKLVIDNHFPHEQTL